MGMPVIQFAELGELISELHPGDVVRVVELETVLSQSSVAPIRTVEVGVHVRHINSEQQVLACYVPTGSAQRWAERPVPREEEKHREAWDRAEALASKLRESLGQRGFAVRGGVIDLGETKLIHGCWSNMALEVERGG